ncbi:MAG: hypothetical protein AB1349_00145 [Elusimicrobiota bacterium]
MKKVRIPTEAIKKLLLPELAELKNGIGELNYKFESQFSALRSEFNGLKSEFQGLRSEFQGLRDKVDGVSNKVDALNSKDEVIKVLLEELKKKL